MFRVQHPYGTCAASRVVNGARFTVVKALAGRARACCCFMFSLRNFCPLFVGLKQFGRLVLIETTCLRANWRTAKLPALLRL